MRRLLFILFAAFALTSRADYDTDALERKADYYFLEGMRQRALGQESLSTALMHRSFDLSANKSGREAFESGSHMMMYGHINRDSLQIARGVALCESYFTANTKDIYAGSYLANYHAENGNPGRAIEIYEILEQEKPENTALMGGHADLLMRVGRINDATAIYRRIERTMGRNTALTRRIVSGMVMQGDTLGALAEINDLIAAQPRSVEALHEGAFLSTALNKPKQGLEYIKKAVALDPTNSATYYHAANIYKKLGDEQAYEKAIFNAIEGDDLDLNPKTELLRYYISEELQPDGTGAEKIDSLFETMVSQYTHDASLRELYTSYLITMQRYTDAAEQMEQAVALDNSKPQNFILLAQLYGSANDFENLIKTTRKGQQFYPNETRFYELRAGAQSRLKLYPEAVGSLREALAIEGLTDQTRSNLYRDIADIAQQDSSTLADSIITNYEEALRLNPENDLAMNNYAYWLAENRGDLLRAKDLIAKAVIFDPGSATYYDTYAWVCYRLGDLENAKRYIDMALLFDKSEQENSPEQLSELLEHAAAIYESLGQLDKAKEYLDRANQLTTPSQEK